MLIPNNKQNTKLFRYANTARFAYNWALGREKENYKNGGKFLSDSDLRKEFTQLKKTEEYSWLKEVSNNVTKQAIKDACHAYKRFFKGCSKFPKFKSRKFSIPSFYQDNVKIQFSDTHVKIEVLAEDGVIIHGVFERSDANERKKEGLPKVKGWIGEPYKTEVEIVENGVHYLVDVENGQKTGFFLDQKYNRLAMQRICKGKRVLDCFTHMGTFALNAGIAGATEVTGLDISEYAVSQATENAKRNGLEDRVTFRCANVFDELPRLAEAGEKYDVVILDPPAFTKSRQATKNAIKGYREINIKGLKLVKDGGYLATCSCSHFMTQELLAKTVREAARSAHKRLRQVEFRTQSPDHPILWAADESYYLKFFIFQVVDEK